MEKCRICERYSLDTREGKPACKVCLALDRVRGLSLRLDLKVEAETLSILHECEAKLRNLKSGGALEGPLLLDPPAGTRWTDVVNVSHQETPKPCAPASGSSRDLPSNSAASGLPVRKRKKKNKGKKREEYQDLRYKVRKGREGYTDRLDRSTSGSDVD